MENFQINQAQDRMPSYIIRAYGIAKRAAAAVNVAHNVLGNPLLNDRFVSLD